MLFLTFSPLLPCSSASFPPHLILIPQFGILFKSPHFALVYSEQLCYYQYSYCKLVSISNSHDPFNSNHPSSQLSHLLSSNYSFLFVSRLFFTQKYLSLNSLMEHHLPLTGEQRTLIEPLLPPNKSAATSQRESNVSMCFSGLDAYRILHVPDRRTER